MTLAPRLDEVAAMIADAMALGANAWVVIVVEPAELSPTLELLHQELEFHARELGLRVGMLAASQLVTSPLPWAGERPPHACLVQGLESLTVEQLTRLDLDRGQFLGSPTIVVVTTPESASRLALHAPNLWSWVGSQFFRNVEPEPMDVESRIRSIRDELGLSEEELVRRVEARVLPLDPVLAEWLVLIGRGDLVDG